MVSAQIIATLRTCYPDKFGVPRQSGLVPDAWGVIEFSPPYRRAEAVRGMDAFSHLWLITRFHLIKEEPASLTVRPPRLGGNQQHGVFATRSPFRPNRLGLSVVKLERVDLEGDAAPRLFVSGVDLVDGTPIIDIKPYIRYADAVTEARSGFAEDRPEVRPVMWGVPELPPDPARSIIEQSLSLQPQPAYHEDCGREYGTEIAGWRVRWTLRDTQAVVIACEPFE